MSTVEAQVQRIVKALEGRPEVYFRLLRRIRDKKICGPWSPVGGDDMYLRHSVGGLVRGSLAEEENGWRWKTFHGDGRPDKRGIAATEELAKAAVDAILREEGWLLA